MSHHRVKKAVVSPKLTAVVLKPLWMISEALCLAVMKKLRLRPRLVVLRVLLLAPLLIRAV
jgi:hypothetical protein